MHINFQVGCIVCLDNICLDLRSIHVIILLQLNLFENSVKSYGGYMFLLGSVLHSLAYHIMSWR